jgi:hypothetical protein
VHVWRRSGEFVALAAPRGTRRARTAKVLHTWPPDRQNRRMSGKKIRVPIPGELAAEVLFRADRTCCVCRVRNKPVQIHHIDDDPSNNSPGNLAVLCFDCHRETQISGGFDRKLDADQVILYRENWLELVQARRVADGDSAKTDEELGVKVELATSLAEIYREAGEFVILAMHYNALGNASLRDKYIEIALLAEPSDDTICFLRKLQNRMDLVSQKYSIVS